MEITLQQFEAMCQNRQLHNGYVEGLGCVFGGLAMSYHLIQHLLNHFPHLSMNW